MFSAVRHSLHEVIRACRGKQFDLKPQLANQCLRPKCNAEAAVQWPRWAAMYIFDQTAQTASTSAAEKGTMHAVRSGTFRFNDRKTQLQSLDDPATACFLAKKTYIR